jgi:hypothetical protein
MTDYSQPTTGAPAPSAPNPLGRVALVLAIVHVAVLSVMAVGQPIAFGTITGAGDPRMTIGTITTVTTVFQLVSLLLALAALIVGLIALRRVGASKIAAAIAIGVGGSSVIGSVFAMVGSFIGAAMSSTSLF